MTTPEQHTDRSRIYFLDNLRTFMILLVVLLHAGLVYESTGMAGFFWIVYDFSTNSLVDELNLILDIFIMAVIFFISGYVAPRSLASKTRVGFLRSKWNRLMVPWAIAVLVLIPLYKMIFLASRGMMPEHWTTYFHFSNGFMSQSWLWFLPVLFLFDVIFVIISRFIKLPNISFAWAAATVFLLGVSQSVIFDVMAWQGWTKSAIFDFQNERLLLYLMMFLLGAFGYKKRIFESRTQSNKLYVAALVLTWIPFLLYRFFYIDAMVDANAFIFSEPLDTLLLWMNFYLSLAGILVVLIFTFKRFFDKHQAISRNLAANSYNVYIIHTIVLGSFAMLLKSVELASIFKFVLLAFSTYAISNGLVLLYRYAVSILMHKIRGVHPFVKSATPFTIK